MASQILLAAPSGDLVRYLVNRSAADDTFEAVARALEEDLERQLKGLGGEIRRVVGVCHHVPFKAVCRSHMGLAGDFFTAFMGSEGLGAVFEGDPRVRAVVFGHQHRPVDQRMGGMRILSTPLGTPRDWAGDVAEVAVERMGHFKLS